MTENLASALAAFQLELPRIDKGNTADAGTYKYKYADLADVSLAVLPLLAKHGLSFSAKPTLDDGGRFVLEYALRHVSGESDTGSYPLPSGSPQQIGSAITYARRYTLSAMTGISPDVDDDGKAASEVHEPHWDPAREPGWDPETQQLIDAFRQEVRGAKADDIADIGRRVRVARDKSELSKVAYDYLARAAAERLAELNGAPA